MRRTSARITLMSVAAGTAVVLAVTAATTANGAPPEAEGGKAGKAVAAAGPIGFGAGTTGGAGGSTVTVSDASAFTEAVQGSGAAIVKVDGTISLSGMTKVPSNKTIVGVGTNGQITGGGLNVSKVNNVIIQNLAFRAPDDDAINVEYADEGLDRPQRHLRRQATAASTSSGPRTTSPCRGTARHDQDKTMLLGHSDDNGGEDSGKLRVTYDHNWFDGTSQRNPRVRFGNPVHVLNNYFSDIGVLRRGVHRGRRACSSRGTTSRTPRTPSTSARATPARARWWPRTTTSWAPARARPAAAWRASRTTTPPTPPPA